MYQKIEERQGEDEGFGGFVQLEAGSLVLARLGGTVVKWCEHIDSRRPMQTLRSSLRPPWSEVGDSESAIRRAGDL